MIGVICGCYNPDEDPDYDDLVATPKDKLLDDWDRKDVWDFLKNDPELSKMYKLHLQLAHITTGAEMRRLTPCNLRHLGVSFIHRKVLVRKLRKVPMEDREVLRRRREEQMETGIKPMPNFNDDLSDTNSDCSVSSGSLDLDAVKRSSTLTLGSAHELALDEEDILLSDNDDVDEKVHAGATRGSSGASTQKPNFTFASVPPKPPSVTTATQYESVSTRKSLQAPSFATLDSNRFTEPDTPTFNHPSDPDPFNNPVNFPPTFPAPSSVTSASSYCSSRAVGAAPQEPTPQYYTFEFSAATGGHPAFSTRPPSAPSARSLSSTLSDRSALSVPMSAHTRRPPAGPPSTSLQPNPTPVASSRYHKQLPLHGSQSARSTPRTARSTSTSTSAPPSINGDGTLVKQGTSIEKSRYYRQPPSHSHRSHSSSARGNGHGGEPAHGGGSASSGTNAQKGYATLFGESWWGEGEGQDGAANATTCASGLEGRPQDLQRALPNPVGSDVGYGAGEVSLEKLALFEQMGKAGNTLAALCSVARVSREAPPNADDPILRNLAQLTVNLTQPEKRGLVFLDPQPKRARGTIHGEMLPSFRVMAGSPLALELVLDRTTMPPINSRCIALLGCASKGSYYYTSQNRPLPECSMSSMFMNGLGLGAWTLAQSEHMPCTPFREEDVRISKDQPLRARIDVHVPEAAGPRGEVLVLNLVVTLAFSAGQGQPSKKLEFHQTVYLSVYKRDSQQLRSLDTNQQPQLSMVNALVDGKEVAVGAGAMVCCPVVLPLPKGDMSTNQASRRPRP